MGECLRSAGVYPVMSFNSNKNLTKLLLPSTFSSSTQIHRLNTTINLKSRAIFPKTYCSQMSIPPSPFVNAMERSNRKEEVMPSIEASLANCLSETNLHLFVPGLVSKSRGKVRDIYEAGDYLILVTTDRVSAFDRVLASIPFKGQVLNETSLWWFEHTRHITENAVVASPDKNVTIAKKCSVFPVEFVVRGFVTGSTDTSLWTVYKKGVRSYCGNALPDGLVKNQKLAANILTPTTKAADHDVPITPDEIISRGLMSKADYEEASRKALSLFEYGQKVALEHGLILVDTKYEFGKGNDGSVLLIDEVHTPDSSRYWIADSYEKRLQEGLEPQNIDKEFLRLWFKEHSNPYEDENLPDAPEELVSELAWRYIFLFETITDVKFELPKTQHSLATRLRFSTDWDCMFIEMGLHEYFLSINNKQRQCWLVISSRNQRKRKRKKKKKKMEGDDESLKLLGHWASPYALRVILALKLKGIDNYIYMEENLPEKSSLLLQYNPVYKKIPVLVHNGKPISESLVIMEYIDETWKQRPLLAKDPYERAKARFWAKFADETCAPATFKVFSAAGAEQVEKASEEARSSLKMLETGFEGRPFFGGEEIGFADVAIGWIGVWAGMVGEIVGVKLIDQNEMPLLSAYFARFLQIPKIRDCFPPQSKLLEHNKAFHHHLLTGKLKY